MVVTIKNKIKSVLLLSLFIFACLSPMFATGQEIKPALVKPTYSWQETTYNYSLYREWTGNSVVINYSGPYADVFSVNLYHYNESEETLIKELRTYSYDGNYSYFSNKTTKGYIDVNMSLDAYRVDVQYGDAVDLVWMALKQGTLEMDYLREQIEEDYSLIEEYDSDIESEFTKFNATTMELIDTWTESSQETGVLNMTVDGDPIDYYSYYSYDIEFSLPLILVMQIYTTENKDNIAWAEMFYDYIIYKDKDQDSIYSAGETSNPSTSGFDLYSSDEMCGVVRPMAWDFQLYNEYTEPMPGNFTIHQIVPFDKTVDEIASTIEFTPPTESAENLISWDVKYPQFPIDAFLNDDDIDPSEWYFTDTSAYDSMSPGDFDYQFDYNLSENRTDFDFTLSLSKISNESLYDALQGYGLSLPHYNYFVSSFDIKEDDPVELTVPSDLFVFESNGTTVAEINMINPVKKKYTLYDYPKLGLNTEMESAGGSLHKLLMIDSEQSANAGNPLVNLIYSITEVAKADPTFTIADDLFHVETQNYPVWNGEKLIHDPTLTIYYDPQVSEEEPSVPIAIPGFNLYATIAVASAVIAIQIIKRRKGINP